VSCFLWTIEASSTVSSSSSSSSSSYFLIELSLSSAGDKPKRKTQKDLEKILYTKKLCDVIQPTSLN
jgi:hypothetical protein